MIKSLCLITFLLLSVSIASATTLVDSLNKHFKKIKYPNDEVVVKITIQTEIPDISGESTKDSVLLSYNTHAKLVSIFKQNGWNDSLLLIDDIDVGLIELELDKGMTIKSKETIRLKAFVHQCDMPMFKYRGGSIDKFFQKQVVEKAEQCFTFDEKLQGKNYPY